MMHSPKPWVSDAHGIITDGSNIIANVNSVYIPYEQFRANANLIAAAPDMYEALKFAYKVLDDMGKQCFTVYDVVEKAINKAEGM